MYAHQPTLRVRNNRCFLMFAVLATILGACGENPTDSLNTTTSVDDRVLLQVSIVPPAPRMQIGDTLVLRAEVRDRDGNLVTDRKPEWKSDTTIVAIVSSDRMLARVVARGDGLARVYAKVGNATGAATVLVAAENAPPLP